MEIDLATRHIGAEFRTVATPCGKTPGNWDYVGLREAAWRSSLSEKTIRSLIRNDPLSHYRNGRSGKILLRWPDFVAWMERRRIQRDHDDHLLDILGKMERARR